MAANSGAAGLGAGLPSAVFGKDCNPPGGCINCVRASALGADLTDEQLRTLCDVVAIGMLSKGETLISEGELDGHLYAVAVGELEVLGPAGDGSGDSPRRLGPGSLAGELAFLDSPRRTATLRVREDACLISLHRDELEGLVAVDPSLAYRIMRAVARSAHRKADALEGSDAESARH